MGASERKVCNSCVLVAILDIAYTPRAPMRHVANILKGSRDDEEDNSEEYDSETTPLCRLVCGSSDKIALEFENLLTGEPWRAALDAVPFAVSTEDILANVSRLHALIIALVCGGASDYHYRIHVHTKEFPSLFK